MVKNKKFFYNILLATIAFFPLYFFPSGLPQISDYLLAVGFTVFLLFNIDTILKVDELYKPIFYLIFFTVWVLTVNFSWALILNKLSFLRVNLMYIYNLLVFTYSFIILKYTDRDKLYKINYAFIVGLIIELIYMLFFGGFMDYGGIRSRGSFNNPNQLAYYSLLAGLILVFINPFMERNKDRNINEVLIYLFFILSLTSLSNSGIVSYIVLLLYFLYEKKRISLSTVIFVIVGILVIDYFDILSGKFFLSLKSRLFNTGNKIESLSQGDRGYDRIKNFPQYWIFGAGEGVYERFSKLDTGHIIEFHSTLGNIQVSYGVIGSILFINYLLSVINKNIRGIRFIFIALLYGLTHNGLRNPLFWILLSLILNYRREK